MLRRESPIDHYTGACRYPHHLTGIAPALPRQPFGTVAIDLLPWELRVGDVVPFDDHIGRPIADIHAVGPGHRARRLILAGLPP
ncbi:hypothetical protein AR457_41410 [Streptomyces agglomeratus]|nr:hypothetical protein AR457_41410 [Streptomyces agglomeratus]